MAVIPSGFMLLSKRLASGPRIGLGCVACQIRLWHDAVWSCNLCVSDCTVDPAWVRLSPAPEVKS